MRLIVDPVSGHAARLVLSSAKILMCVFVLTVNEVP
jgi:hypothetical protein